MRRPAFVIADEPVSALDMTVQKQILSLLAALQQRHGFACLFISHDLGAGAVEEIADRVLLMEAGRIVEEGPRDAVFDAPRHPYTRRLLSAMTVLGGAGAGFSLHRRGAGWQRQGDGDAHAADAAASAPVAEMRGGLPPETPGEADATPETALGAKPLSAVTGASSPCPPPPPAANERSRLSAFK